MTRNFLDGLEPEERAIIRAFCDNMDRRGGWGYKTVKELSNLLNPLNGTTLADVLAMGAANDPFYIGPQPRDAVPGRVAEADWLETLWRRLGITRPVHDRRLHYAIMSLGDVQVTLGRGRRVPYTVGDESWRYLMGASWAARYLHRIPFDMIEDQRNPNAWNTYFAPPMELDVSVDQDDVTLDSTLPDMPPAPSYALDTLGGDDHDDPQITNQRYHLEVWVEKTTQNDLLEPWCEEHGAVLVAAQGHMSVTGAYQTVRRIIRHGKPAILFYISDFDAAGQNMPLEIARKIQRFVQVEFKDQDVPPICLQPVALTFAQVQEYHLPMLPLKRPDSKPARRWQARYGADVGTCELDALEVQHPGALIELLDAAAAPYYDATLGERIAEEVGDMQDTLNMATEAVVAAHEERLRALSERWGQAIEQVQALLQPIWDEFATEHATIVEELEDDLPDLPDLPEAYEADPALADEVFFASTRSYLDQQVYYQQYKHEAVVDVDSEEGNDES